MFVILKNRNNQEQIKLHYSPSTSSSIVSATSDQQSKIDEVLYPFDAFNVSDEFYHELSMVVPHLPRSYLIKQRRNEISSNVPIKRQPRPK